MLLSPPKLIVYVSINNCLLFRWLNDFCIVHEMSEWSRLHYSKWMIYARSYPVAILPTSRPFSGQRVAEPQRSPPPSHSPSSFPSVDCNRRQPRPAAMSDFWQWALAARLVPVHLKIWFLNVFLFINTKKHKGHFNRGHFFKITK